MEKRIIPCKLLCMLLSCCLLLSLLAACDSGETNNGDATSTPTPEAPAQATPAPAKTNYVVDFNSEKIGFLMANTGSPGTDPDTSIAIKKVDGESSLAITAPNGKIVRVGINVDGLLGDRVTQVKTVVMDVYAEYPDGNFSAVSGRIGVMSGITVAFAESNWQVYLATRNPNQAIFEFDADQGFSAEGPNLVEFSCLVNGPADKGETPAIIHIKSISFYDANNVGLPLDLDAGWAAPEGYGEGVTLSEWEMLNPPPQGDPGGWQTWLTPATDNYGKDDMPWEILAASYGIVFEITEKPESFGFVHFGHYNGWGWTQFDNVQENWADGKMAIMWNDIGFDPTLINDAEEGATGAKLAFGNWNAVQIDRIYLLYDANLVP